MFWAVREWARHPKVRGREGQEPVVAGGTIMIDRQRRADEFNLCIPAFVAQDRRQPSFDW